MIKKLALFILLSVSINMLAQNYIVESLKPSDYDLSAVKNMRRDLNQKKCAIIKVQSLDPVKKAEGNVIGDIPYQYNESWIYITGGSKYVKLFFENHTPLTVSFADYYNDRIDEGCTYELLLSDNTPPSNNSKSQTIQNPPVPIAAAQNATAQNSNINVKANLSKSDSGSQITVELNGVKFDMIKCEGGTFIMGDPSDAEDDAEDNKKKTDKVILHNYYIGKYEVTQKIWQIVMDNNPSHFKGDELPVEKVSWNDCQTFISRLNSLTARNFRLPTEAEWEYAAKGGRFSNEYEYSGSKKLKNVGWYDDTSKDKTHEVGTKSPNELGLYDMSGNVWEWCEDEYHNGNTEDNASITYRVYCGGAWSSPGWDCKPSSCSYANPVVHYDFLGFRLALSE